MPLRGRLQCEIRNEGSVPLFELASLVMQGFVIYETYVEPGIHFPVYIVRSVQISEAHRSRHKSIRKRQRLSHSQKIGLNLLEKQTVADLAKMVQCGMHLNNHL